MQKLSNVKNLGERKETSVALEPWEKVFLPLEKPAEGSLSGPVIVTKPLGVASGFYLEFKVTGQKYAVQVPIAGDTFFEARKHAEAYRHLNPVTAVSGKGNTYVKTPERAAMLLIAFHTVDGEVKVAPHILHKSLSAIKDMLLPVASATFGLESEMVESDDLNTYLVLSSQMRKIGANTMPVATGVLSQQPHASLMRALRTDDITNVLPTQVWNPEFFTHPYTVDEAEAFLKCLETQNLFTALREIGRYDTPKMEVKYSVVAGKLIVDVVSTEPMPVYVKPAQTEPEDEDATESVDDLFTATNGLFDEEAPF